MSECKPEAKKRKTDTVSEKTFKKWWFSNDFTINTNENDDVCKIFCKVCTDNFVAIRREASARKMKGSALDNVKNYVDGVSFVHKGNVERHVKSGGLHDWAKKTSSPSASSSGASSSEKITSQVENKPKISEAFSTTLKERCKNAFITALYVAKEEKPMNEFNALVQLQRKNGVKFLVGKDSSIACKEFISYIAASVRDDLKKILNLSNFFSGEQDGSQARKTGATKELVFAKVVVNGVPVEILLKCQHMDDYGEDAASIKKAFDDTFLMDYEVDREKFIFNMISICADGASVNMGSISGACASMKVDDNREWLLILHCANHRLEREIKEAFKTDTVFTKVDEMMTTVYYMVKNSGKVKRILQQIALNLGVTFVNFAQCHGTRFQNHKYCAIKAMIINFLSLCLYAENMVAGGSSMGKVDTAKLRGYLKYWESYEYLSALHTYRQVLRETAHLSHVLQSRNCLITDITSTVDECILSLDKISEQEADLPFEYTEDDSGDIILTAKSTNLPATQVFKESHTLTKKQLEKIRKYTNVHTCERKITNVTAGKLAIKKVKDSLIPNISNCIDSRLKSFRYSVIGAFAIVDHTSWDFDDSDFGICDVKKIAEHFSAPLSSKKFILSRAISEFRELKTLVGVKYRHFKSKLVLWQQIFEHHRSKFPYILLLIELCLVVAWCSASVERGFGTLSRLMTNTRLSLGKRTLDDLLVITVNLPVLTQLDSLYEDKLVEKAVNAYLVSKTQNYKTKSATGLSSGESVRAQSKSESHDSFLPIPFNAAVYTSNPLLNQDDAHLQNLSDSDSDTVSDSSDESE